jgi:hypothetical protein
MSGRGREPERWLEQAKEPAKQALRQAMDEGAAPADSEVAKQRVWQRVQAPWAGGQGARGRGWLAPMLFGAGAAAALGVAVLYGTGALRPEGRATVAQAPPPARHEPPRPEVIPLPPRSPAALTTGPGERARHRLARGVDVDLAPQTALLAGDVEGPPEVRVGRVRFTVPKQEPGHRYLVRAGAFQVTVVGTVFVVSVEERGVSVQVESGVVEVGEAASGKRLERLEPGEKWTSAAARAARPVEASDPALARTLEEAREARKIGDAPRALALYGQLARAGGPLAETSLWEMGSIQEKELHDPRQALEVWAHYRALYPRGQFREETDLSVIEALARLGEERRALEEALSFLRKHPASERRGEVARVAGDLQRTRGDCKAAAALYETALASRLSDADAENTAFHRAACLAQLHDPAAAEAARAYLSRFPAGAHAAEVKRLVDPPAPGGR